MTSKKNINDQKKFARKVSELQEFIETYGDEIRVLNDKEIKVLNMVSNGKSNTQIAEELNISTAEIESTKKDITQKLSLPGQESFLEYAVVSSLLRIWLDSLSLIEEKDIDVDFNKLDSD